MWSALRTKRVALFTGATAHIRERSMPWGKGAADVGVYAADDVGAALSALRRTRLTPRLEVLLGAELCRFVVMDRPDGVTARSEAQAVLKAHAEKALGLKQNEWTITLDNSRRRQLVGCATRQSVLEKIEGWCDVSGHRVSAITPLATSSAAQRLWKGASTALSVGSILHEPRAVTAISISQKRFRASTARLDGHEGAANRVILNVTEGRPVGVYRLLEKSERAPRTDFADLMVLEADQ